MDDRNPLFPSKSELSARALFASTPEERELASMLSQQTLPGKDEESAWSVLERLYPAGSEQERQMYQTPVGKIVKEILDAQESEDDPADYPVQFSEEFEELISKPVVPAPPVIPPEISDLADRTSLARRIFEHGNEGPKIERPVKVELPESDWGFGSGTII
jgi:hypothetical protein